VLLIAQTGVLGGAERVLLDWSRAVASPVILACPPGPLVDAAAAAGHATVPLVERPLRRRGRSARAAADVAALAAEVARLARTHRPAVVVASGLRPVLAAAAVPLAGAPLIVVHHDLPQPAVAAALRAASRRAIATVAASGAVAEQVRPRRAGAHASRPVGAPVRGSLPRMAPHDAAARTTPPSGEGAASDSAVDAPTTPAPGDDVVVIHPGVDAAEWALPDPPPGPPRALVLGALVPWKRADLALEIAARIPELRLDVAGAPLTGDALGFEAALHARAARADLVGRVRFLGALTDPRPALTDAHALLHCADREPFGLALVEALAAGRPVAAPAGGGPLEILTPACGRLYTPGDAATGASALQALLGDPDAPAAARARAARFDSARSARRFAAVVAAARRRA
jgi:glycosyltransferase involved in cell wall biosynthesis